MKTIKEAPDVLNTNDKAMWALGYNEAADRIDELEKQLADAISRIPARHAETKVKQMDQVAPANLAFWGIVENEEVECS